MRGGLAQIVDTDNGVPITDETVNGVVADETGGACYENFHDAREVRVGLIVTQRCCRYPVFYSSSFLPDCNLFRAKLFGFYRLFYPADGITSELYDITRFKVLRRVHAHAYTTGGTGRDDITCIQREET